MSTTRPCIYIHRVEWCPADYYMTPANIELLNAFAEVRDHGADPEPAGHEQLVAYMRGADGMLLWETSGAETRLPSLAQEVFDPTGAGDTVAAVLTLGVGAGLDLPTAITLANAAAGEVVRHVGTVSITPDELRRAAGRG